MVSGYVAQAGLKPLASNKLLALASQSVRIAGVSQCTWPLFKNKKRRRRKKEEEEDEKEEKNNYK